jgi:hypothetical protein
MEPEIPSEVRRSIDGEAARLDVISPKVTSASLRKSANENCAYKTKKQKEVFGEDVF